VATETKPTNLKTNDMTVASELAALRATLEAKMQADDREREEAKAQREAMSKDIQAIRIDASQTANRVENLENEMGKVKPVIAKVNSWQSMVLGGLIVFGMIGGAVSVFWDAVRERVGAWIAGG
jgi:uncharacterized coiled-coil DUF342 family protein